MSGRCSPPRGSQSACVVSRAQATLTYCPSRIRMPVPARICWLCTPQPSSLADGGPVITASAFCAPQSAGAIAAGTPRFGVERARRYRVCSSARRRARAADGGGWRRPLCMASFPTSLSFCFSVPRGSAVDERKSVDERRTGERRRRNRLVISGVLGVTITRFGIACAAMQDPRSLSAAIAVRYRLGRRRRCASPGSSSTSAPARLPANSGETIPLTRGEFALLRIFVSRPGRVRSAATPCSTRSPAGGSSHSTAASICWSRACAARSSPIPKRRASS